MNPEEINMEQLLKRMGETRKSWGPSWCQNHIEIKGYNLGFDHGFMFLWNELIEPMIEKKQNEFSPELFRVH